MKMCVLVTVMGYSVVVRKLFNVKIYCMKYFGHEIFVIYSSCSVLMYTRIYTGGTSLLKTSKINQDTSQTSSNHAGHCLLSQLHREVQQNNL